MIKLTLPKIRFDWRKYQPLYLPLSIFLGAIVIAAAILATGGLGRIQVGSETGVPAGTRADVSADDDPVLGDVNAPVTLIEFSDFQCPYCLTFWREVFPQLKSTYIDTGKVRFVYRDYPLPFHAMAQTYAEAAQCANEQGKYWEMHDQLFTKQEGADPEVELTVADVKSWAREIGLDGDSFDQCLDTYRYAEEVQKDLSDGQTAGVQGTPSFFVNGLIIEGAQPFESFQALIEQELAAPRVNYTLVVAIGAGVVLVLAVLIILLRRRRRRS